jgi:hypothetical protein
VEFDLFIMTNCEHCIKVSVGGQKEFRCGPLSSTVVSHGKTSLRHYLIQDCPTEGELTRDKLEGCLVSEEASEPRRSMMRRVEWDDFDRAIQNAKLNEVRKGRIFAEIRSLEVKEE